jgi:hypothetical protein
MRWDGFGSAVADALVLLFVTHTSGVAEQPKGKSASNTKGLTIDEFTTLETIGPDGKPDGKSMVFVATKEEVRLPVKEVAASPPKGTWSFHSQSVVIARPVAGDAM